MEVKYPSVKLELVGQDGNAFSILGRACVAMRKASLSRDVMHVFSEEARSGDYNHLLQTCMNWFDCDGHEEDSDEE